MKSTLVLVVLFILTTPSIAQNILDDIFILDFKIEDNYLFLSTPDEPVFRVINLKDSTMIAGFGKLGRGPGEILEAADISVRSINDDQEYLIYYVEYETNILKSFNFNTKTLKAIANKDFQLPLGYTGIISATLISDSVLVGTYDDHFRKKRHEKRVIISSNLKDSTFVEQPLFQLTTNPYELMAQLNINARDLLFDYQNNDVITLTLNSNIVEKYNVIDNSITTYYLESEEALFTNIKLEDYSRDEYLYVYSQIGELTEIYFTLQNRIVDNSSKNIINLYTKNFEKIDSKLLNNDFHFDISRTYKKNNSIILYSYEYGGLYELPIKDGRVGELRPFLRD